MAKYKLTKKAVEDLAKIWNYTFEKWSEKQADIYYEILISNCKTIARNPNLGKSYDIIMPNLFGLKTNRHIVFYRIIDENNIEITRILHGRMDLRKRMKE
jgi:toxin ParE1/3/4